MSQLQGGGRPVNSKVFARHTSPSHWPLDCSQGRDFRSCRTPPGTTNICVCDMVPLSTGYMNTLYITVEGYQVPW